ncbi:SH3 domain-containing protein [Falsihalocynthiibacter arcticus]|uniref:SH3b domain-containing protein n=1 Tax=Falsihalocynthiibacter arcticus TaxID=1579316 RepID=A0A126V0N1_9RHOB|nr:hypothetical protein [Falsihalocynthiibacter arcticus]AML51707.1 hypothetical protein RC74_10935 [Falsihalocynthiibacter arcticus]
MMTRNILRGVTFVVGFMATAAFAQIDGHGPDSWRVTGVAANDVLNVRMGPGTAYPVIETFAPDTRGLEQITCVPYYALRHYSEMTEAQINALPPRWCLMRGRDMMRAGWVAGQFIRPDDEDTTIPSQESLISTGDPLLDQAQALVRELYVVFEMGGEQGDNPFYPPTAERYFFAGLAPKLAGHGSDVMYDAQDFQGQVTRIAPDADRPMLRGMITINVDFINFGQQDRAVFSLRADTSQQGAPFRIFRIEHGDWSFPQ